MDTQHFRLRTPDGHERGMAVLVGVMATALLMSVTIGSLLLLSTNRARLGFHEAWRLRAWYAAEAGLWWAQEQLRRPPATTQLSDPAAMTDPVGDVDLTVGGLDVDVEVVNEPPAPAPPSGIKRIVCHVNYTRE